MPNEFTPQIADMSLVQNRLDLILRYNSAIGKPGPHVTALQREFGNGFMNERRQSQYVLQCEYMIAARQRKPSRTLRTWEYS